MDPIEFVDRHAEELISLCGELVRIPSENPPGDERAVVSALQDAAQRFGLADAFVEALDPKRPNLLVRLRGAVGSRKLLFITHVDTKAVGETSKWTRPPMDGKVEGEWLYGRGACDAKASVAAMLGAAWAISACQWPFAGELLLVFAADEEAGGGFGMRHLLAKGLSGTAAVVGEPSGFRSSFEFLHVASRGMYNFKIRVRGQQGHSGLSDLLKPVNANLKAAELLLKLHREFKPACPRHPQFPDGATVNAGVWTHGGVFYGVTPGEAEFGTDIRTVPGMSRDTLRAELTAFLEAASAADPDLDAELLEEPAPLGWGPAYEISPDHALVQSAREALAAVLGKEPPLAGYPAITDARFLCRAQIPALPALGPGLLTDAHAADERVAVADIAAGAKIYTLTALNYLVTSPK
jgi:acetylornithine deacetylase/succinyl-diaminopimelate desuccinylase-like protein